MKIIKKVENNTIKDVIKLPYNNYLLDEIKNGVYYIKTQKIKEKKWSDEIKNDIDKSKLTPLITKEHFPKEKDYHDASGKLDNYKFTSAIQKYNDDLNNQQSNLYALELYAQISDKPYEQLDLYYYDGNEIYTISEDSYYTVEHSSDSDVVSQKISLFRNGKIVPIINSDRYAMFYNTSQEQPYTVMQTIENNFFH